MKAKDVKLMQKWGKENEVIAKLMGNDCHHQPRIYTTGYYTPSNANWSWEFGLVKIDGITYELLTRFGQVGGGREIYIPEYMKEELS